ncbi:MAG TPA: hypothetical protein VFN68_03490 [Acidimicrobiales bacterium]|nr:hypothetical protein [Acidimicrobiales bacterium]
MVVASLLGLVVAASGRSTPAPSRSAPPAGSPASGPSPGSPAAGPPAGPAPPFRWSDPTLTTPIPADAVLSSRSAGWARQLATGPALDIYEYGTGIYRADSSTPTQRVRMTQERSRGPTALSGRTVSMPTGQALLDLIPSGTDGSFVVMQPDGRHEVDIWQPVVSGSGASAHLVSASYGDYYASGNAWHDATGAIGQGTGSGKAMGAGAITDSELRAALASVGQPGGGVIPHALNFSSSMSSSDYVAPAGRSDGDSGGGIPEGQRIRLDPTIDLAAISGITPLELVIGRTLQTYGAYVTDSGGASMAFGVQLPSSVPGGSWLAQHHVPDYYNMPHLPWASGLQVLKSWDGS